MYNAQDAKHLGYLFRRSSAKSAIRNHWAASVLASDNAYRLNITDLLKVIFPNIVFARGFDTERGRFDGPIAISIRQRQFQIFIYSARLISWIQNIIDLLNSCARGFVGRGFEMPESGDRIA